MQSTLVDQQIVQNFISYEYIRGLIEGEGCFSFCPGWKMKNGRKCKLPAFIISMHERDEKMIYMIRDKLGLRNKVYNQKPWLGDGINRGRKATLIIREFDQLKDIIIPLFYKKLHGYKGIQFVNWLEKIGNDPDVSDRYKSLYRLYKWGIYDENRFLNKFKD